MDDQPSGPPPPTPYGTPSTYGQPQPQPGWQPWPGGPYPAAPPAPPPPPPPGTNRWAIAALVTSILGTVCFASAVLAVVALVQVTKTRQKGQGMAIAALIVTAVWVVGAVTAGVVVAIHEERRHDREVAAAIQDGEAVAIEDLVVGDCLVTAQLDGDDLITDLPQIPCTSKHDTEVYALLTAPGSSYPGDDEMSDLADDLCTDRFTETFPEDVVDDSDYGTFYLYPSVGGWGAGDRAITCMVITDDLRTGSLTD